MKVADGEADWSEIDGWLNPPGIVATAPVLGVFRDKGNGGFHDT